MLKGVRVVAVEPEYQLNLGMIARACNNFGCSELFLVRPKIRVGFTARMFAKHSEKLLKGARVVGTLAEAVKGSDLVIGTTGAQSRFNRQLKKCISPEKAVELAGNKKVALVFGSEGKGLSAEEIADCDLICCIPGNPAQPILNLSHAVAVMLYSFFNARATPVKPSSRRQKKPTGSSERNSSASRKALEKQFGETLEELNMVSAGAQIRDPEKVVRAFKNVLNRSQLEEDEAQALLAFFSKARKCALHAKNKKN